MTAQVSPSRRNVAGFGKKRHFDFVIRDEAIAEECGEFTSQVLYDSVDDHWSPWVCSQFSRSFRAYHLYMFLVTGMLCMCKPLRWCGGLRTGTWGIPVDIQEDMCWVLEGLFICGHIWILRYSVLYKQWEFFHPLYIVESHARKWTFWMGVCSTVVGFALLSLPPYSERYGPMMKSIDASAKYGDMDGDPSGAIWGFYVILGFIEEMRLYWVWHCFGEENHGCGADLVQFLVAMCLATHFLGCVWYGIVWYNGTIPLHMTQDGLLHAEEGADATWYVTSLDTLDAERRAIDLYLFSIREVMMMLLCDGRPAYSNYELVFSIFVGFVGGLVCCGSIFIARVIQYQRNANMLADNQQEHLSFSKQALKTMDVPPQLVERIMSFQHFALRSYNHQYNAVLFDNISAPLALELRLALYHDLLVNAPFLTEASANVVKKLVMDMKDALYQPGDFVVRKNEPADEMFFIVRGICDILADLDKAIICTFFAGDYFGEIAILQQTQGARCARRTAWVRSSAHTNLCTLGIVEFEDTFQRFPEEKAALIERLRKILPNGQEKQDEPTGREQKTYIRNESGVYFLTDELMNDTLAGGRDLFMKLPRAGKAKIKGFATSWLSTVKKTKDSPDPEMGIVPDRNASSVSDESRISDQDANPGFLRGGFNRASRHSLKNIDMYSFNSGAKKQSLWKSRKTSTFWKSVDDHILDAQEEDEVPDSGDGIAHENDSAQSSAIPGLIHTPGESDNRQTVGDTSGKERETLAGVEEMTASGSIRAYVSSLTQPAASGERQNGTQKQTGVTFAERESFLEPEGVEDVMKEFVNAQHQSQQVLRGLQDVVSELSRRVSRNS